MSTCENCGKAEDADEDESSKKKLLRCGACGSALYCSAQCQRDAWPNHKTSCTQIACSALMRAIRDGDASKVQRLSKTPRVVNGRVDFQDELDRGSMVLRKWTALHQCVRFTKPELMKILLEPDKKAKVDIQDNDGEPPIFLAADGGKAQAAQLLLEAGADPNFQSHDGWTPLMVAVRCASFDTAKLLLDAGADVNLGRDMFGRTALDIATFTAAGQGGLRLSRNQSLDEATANARRLVGLLTPYYE